MRASDASRPKGFGAAVCDEAQERPDATADVEHTLTRLERNTLERRLVARKLLLLAERPIVGPGAPQRPPPLRTSRDCVADVIAAPSLDYES